MKPADRAAAARAVVGAIGGPAPRREEERAPTHPINFADVPAPYCPLGCVGGCKKAKRVREGEWTRVTPSPECELIPGIEAERMARAGTLPPGGVWVGLGTPEDVAAHARRIGRGRDAARAAGGEGSKKR